MNWPEFKTPNVAQRDLEHQPVQQTRRAAFGFTLIELLIGMTILGVILLAASGLLQGNQKVTSDTQTRSNALGDARGAVTRITETLNQAAYIYPANSIITVSSGSLAGQGVPDQITTGSDAIAVLISNGAVPPKYQGVIYYLANRAETKFAADLVQLPADRIAQHVLVEARTIGVLNWPAKSVPVQSWGLGASEGILVDGVDDDNSLTNLMASGAISPTGGSDGTVFEFGPQTAKLELGLSNPKLLISTVGFSVGIRVATSGKALAESGTTVLRGLANARNVPRQ
jgi:prepilin-type N-terminal cleavage/methylation domain-containing protein